MIRPIERIPLTEKKQQPKTVASKDFRKAHRHAEGFLETLGIKVDALKKQMQKASEVEAGGARMDRDHAERLCILMKLAADVMDWGEREACDVRIQMLKDLGIPQDH